MTIEDLSQKIDRFAQAVDKRFDSVEKKIEDEVGNLAAMTAREFGRTNKKIDDLRKEHLVHDFKMTEMTHKSDHFHLKERVGIIEEKVGLKGK